MFSFINGTFFIGGIEGSQKSMGSKSNNFLVNFHGENGSQSEKWDFWLFCKFFTKGIYAKLNELESESDISPKNERQSWQI